jgi:hypothetical protein
MFVGSSLSAHPSLTGNQVAVYASHEGHLVELLRDVTPGATPSWVHHGAPPNSCVAYPPSVVWADDSAAPIRVFCTTTDGRLAARLLDYNTRAPQAWEVHDDAPAPSVFTPPGASVSWGVTIKPGCLTAFLPWPEIRVTRTSLFVGATNGRLWERTRTGGAFQWIDHGNPPGTCIVGEPMTDPSLVPPSSPLRIFVATAAGTLAERVLYGPSAFTWIDHGRPSTAAGPVNVGSGGCVVDDAQQGAVHVFVAAGSSLHRLTIPSLGAPGAWSMLPLPPAASVRETTWIAAGPNVGTTASGASLIADFFVVGGRRTTTGALVGAPIEEVLQCRSDLRVPGDLTYVANLGPPGRAAPTGTDYYVITNVRGLAVPQNRVYASTWPAQGGDESLDEWTFSSPGGAATLGLPAALPAPCRATPPTMMTCGGPRRFTVGSSA